MRVALLAVPALSETSVGICIFSLLFIPFAAAGLALINAGLGRSRSAAHSLMASLCVFATAAIIYSICGSAWQGSPAGAAHLLSFAGKTWNWLGAGRFLLRVSQADSPFSSLVAWFGLLSAGLAAMIPVSAGADRWRLGASCASTALLAGWTYPLFAHWVWGGGWLAQLGQNCRLGHGFVDVGGSGPIHAVGGLTALSVAWILGPRRGKYSLEGMPAAIPGHNAVLVVFACFLALAGWLGLNSAGAVLFAGATAADLPRIGINTTLWAASSALASAVITRVRFGKPDASLSTNGWVGGLVASSAACSFVPPAAALAGGLAAGTLVTLAVEWLELRLGVDDPGGAVSVHAVGGIWGIIALAIFVRFPTPVNAIGGTLPGATSGASGQWVAQLVGVATLLGFVLPLSYGLNLLLDRVYPQRVAAEGERQGMDLYELGAGAYPEFMTHTEDFMR